MSIHNFPAEAKSHVLDMLGGPGSDATNKMFQAQGLGYLWGFGTAVPASAETGYAKSCIYQHTDETTGEDNVYINIGDTDSANFVLMGSADLSGTGGAGLVGTLDAGSIFTGTTVEAVLDELGAVRDTEALATDVAASVLIGLSTLNGTASCDVTLADGTHIGDLKTFRCITSISNPPTVTVATHQLGTSRAVYTFNVIGDSAVLQWDGLQWNDVGGNVEAVETATGTFTASAYGTTDINSSGGAVTVTLGSGAFPGQIKVITCFVNADTSSTVSITNHQSSDPEVATFDALDETGVFMWSGTEWVTIFATCTFV